MGARDYIRSLFSRTNKPRKVYEQSPDRRVITLRRISQTEWEYEQIASALQMADQGDYAQLGAMTEAIRGDGTAAGQIATVYDGIQALERCDESSNAFVTAALTKAFPGLAPASEVKLLASDGDIAGVGAAEIIEPRPGVLTLHRHPVASLVYRENEDQWFLRTKSSVLEPITPGDGRWLLYLPYGRYMPHRHALWRALGRNYILKEQALISLSIWNGSLATPAKVLKGTKGRNEEEGELAIRQVDSWGFLPSYLLPEGWDLDLLQADQRSADSFKQMVEICDRDTIFTLSGTQGLAETGAGFGNTNVFASVKASIIKARADSIAQCITEQLLPTWARYTFGYEGFAANPSVRWNTTPPRDRKAEADAANTMGQAIKAWQDAGARVDRKAMADRYGMILLPDDEG